MPTDFPAPATATVLASKQLPGASGHRPGTVVSVAVPASLRDQILFARKQLLKAGFVLGRGDAEADEADIPFARSDVTGQLRLHEAGICRTTWVLTVLPR